MQRKKRIAFFGDDFSRQGKGTALVIQKLAEQIVTHHTNDFEVVLLRPVGKCLSSVCDRVKHVIIPRKFSTMLSYYWFFLTHAGEYDTVVFNRVVYPGFWFLRARKFVAIVHDASCSEVYIMPRTLVNRVFDFLLKYVGKFFLDAVIGDSNDARKWIARYYDISLTKVHALYLAADDEYTLYDSVKRSEKIDHLKHTYGIRSPYFLGVSRFDPHKNIERVLDAFLALKANDSLSYSLVLVGGRHTPSYSDRIEVKIRGSVHSGSILVLPYVEQKDMPAIYNCANMLIYPSLIEGFGLPLVEAMKCGTPIVTSNISCLPEVAGDAAVLVDPMDTNSVVRGIQRVLSDDRLRETLISKGLDRSELFSWSKTTDTFLRII